MCWDGSYECDASDCPDQPGGSVDIMFNSDTDIAGFQFNVAGVDVTGAGGGAAGAAGFTVSTGNNTVIGFSLQGSTIPAGEGVLVVLDVAGSGDACLEDVIISDSSGNALDAAVENCTTISIGDDCPSGNYDCAGVCDGDAVEDCAGECGGSAEVDECGDCNGDGPDMCWDGSYECDASDCPDQPGGSVEVYYNTSTPIAGFQFNVDGVSITGAAGGAADGFPDPVSPFSPDFKGIPIHNGHFR